MRILEIQDPCVYHSAQEVLARLEIIQAIMPLGEQLCFGIVQGSAMDKASQHITVALGEISLAKRCLNKKPL